MVIRGFAEGGSACRWDGSVILSAIFSTEVAIFDAGKLPPFYQLAH